MNIAFFIRPKSMVTYLYAHSSLQKGLRCLQTSGRSALPVLSGEGKYLGTVSEGDFLWHLAKGRMDRAALRAGTVGDLLRADGLQAVSVTTAVEELPLTAAEQTFVPVVDDAGSFIGVAERSDLLRHLVGAWKAGSGIAESSVGK